MQTTLRLLASHVLWGATGHRALGRSLVGALVSDDEDERTIAGMLLTRAGRRAEPLLEEALKEGRHRPAIIEVLGSIGDPAMVPELRPFEQNEDPEVARAARDAIRVIGAATP